MLTVTDFRGREIPKERARYIKGNYYEVDVDCIDYGGLSYRNTSKKLVFDHSSKKYVHINEINNLVQGIVGPKGETGYFRPNHETIIISRLEVVNSTKKFFDDVEIPEESRDGFDLRNYEQQQFNKGGKIFKWRRSYAINEQIADLNGYVECFSTEVWYKLSDCSEGMRKAMGVKRTPPEEMGRDIHNLEDAKDKDMLIKAYEDLKIPIGVKSHKLAFNIPYSFGVEFEISNGFIPKRHRLFYGLKALRDGSVSNTGTELVTMPMKGAKGIEVLKHLGDLISRRCEQDGSCSTHIHLGSFDRTKVFALSLFNLCSKIQDEMFKMMPASRLMPSPTTGKIYCQKLPNIGLNTARLLKIKDHEEYNKAVVEEFTRIYTFLNDMPPGHIYDTKTERLIQNVEGEEIYRYIVKTERYTTKSTRHHVRGGKWNRNARYYWMNMLCTYFTSYGTVEWRCHETTHNKYKIIYWLAICSAIMTYAKDSRKCLGNNAITLAEIMKEVYPADIAQTLINYINYRKDYFYNSDGSPKKNYKAIEEAWIKGDEAFVFEPVNNPLV